jgi:PmbA protein
MISINLEPSFKQIETLANADRAEVELLVERSEKLQLSFQKGQPEKFDSSISQVAGLRVIANGYEGYSYSENLSDEALVSAYREALNNANFIAKSDDPSLKVKLMNFESSKANSNVAMSTENPELFNDSISKVGMDEKLRRGRSLEVSATDVDRRIASVPYNAYVETEGELQILTSTGVRRIQRQSGVMAYSYCLAKDGKESRMAGESVFSRQADKIDTTQVAQIAAKKAIAKLGAESPVTGRYPVVIENEVAAEFFELIADYFSAKSVFEKTSLLARRLGEAIAHSHLTLTDDPFFSGGVGTRSFDSEGAPVQRTVLIENGVLKHFLTNSVYAERLGLEHTASASRGARDQLDIGISNLVVSPGEKTFEQLLTLKPTVILITNFNGYHAGFNHSSGDFSLQAEGELWQNGQRVRPLCDFVVSGNILELLLKIENLSNRMITPKGSVIAPDIFVSELSIAGVS